MPRPTTRTTRYLPILIAVILAMAGALLSVVGIQAATPTVRVLDVDGTITPVMARYIDHGIQDANRRGDSAVVLRMNTPGGLSSAMDDIVQSILNSNVPVVVYVAPQGARAGSAGVYITYAAHVAAMAPSTNIGSATPIFLSQSGEPQNADADLTRKVVNDAVARIRGLADLRGRNADWAEQAVREAVNVNATDAQRLKVVDLVSPDLPTLLDQIDGRQVQTPKGLTTLHTKGATISTQGMGLPEQILQAISDPTIAYLLLSLGMLGIFLEFSHPGTVLPGAAGGISIVLALVSLGSLDINWAGILLMGLGFLLLAADVYLPSHGALTVGGIASFGIGSLMLANSLSGPALGISRVAIVVVTSLLAGFFVFVASAVLRARLRPSTTGREGLRGAVGVARQPLDPEGYVFVMGELWRAVSLAGRIEEDQPVRVVDVDGLTVTVVPAEEDALDELSAHRAAKHGRLVSKLRPSNETIQRAGGHRH